MRPKLLLLFAALCASLAALADPDRHPAPPQESSPVTVIALPAGGIQPQAVVDAQGVIHVVYFSGQPSGGDLYYVRLVGSERTMSTPVRVNSVAGTALAAGSVRGAQISVGRGGRVHVAWHGSKPVAATDPLLVPMWYARSAAESGRFESQRVLSGKSKGLDGGTVGADRSGHVVVAWHAMGDRDGEGHRTVYLARSADDGATFSPPTPATLAPVGACGCCGLRAIFDRSGVLHILYRAATNGKHRDTTWLMIDGSASRQPVRVHPWELESCPMSTYSLAETSEGVAAAWETAQQIYSTDLITATGSFSPPSAIPGDGGSRKHPSIAVNAAGDRLIAWTEGTAWKRGGTFAWRLTDRSGKQRAASANAGVVPTWGLVSAVSLPDGSFAILK
jgi:hypothetical protein